MAPEAEPTTAQAPPTKERLDELSTAAALQYKLKDYTASADLYAEASEIQAALNGELAPENAELLFLYARALHKVGMAKSDVLGNKVAQEEKQKKEQKQVKAESSKAANGSAKDGVEAKPYFQLTGDENWTDDEDEEEEGGEEEEDDDLQTAFEICEVARVCFEKQLEAITAGNEKERVVKERLADCHALLAEVSLENERFHEAATDARKALALQEELYPLDHGNVSEAHYILSLALELAAIRKQQPENEDGENKDDTEGQEIDYEMRKEAAKHTELAIKSVEGRLLREETALKSPDLSPEDKKSKEAGVKDLREMLEELKTRLADLNEDPKNQAIDFVDPSVFQGIIGGLLGANPADQKKVIEAATQNANDISGLVKTRKKEKVPAPAPAMSADPKGKRKLGVDIDDASKRAKTEEA
ncbi:hypothetical protein M011DRAFT_486851 [Sporormia fimetaria CBS 119925]|uniref:Tetratricopeptide SHNi-TPR domain-containing protein n=1 Tax=Sporormia fimetaria CBS 119925 TaxID=1340428 RepID=A0A6A6V875_9PLEO|nr:hypothetical protein M011DRAFT_486851 [Sporormia fimetaria CBS 119925]